ncbi:hypothetical protein ASA01S_023_00440 [Aeromonas salmonicida subsp. masoucida NBRC 13784]|nr:hypothetical protein ASA01S_023_00440 [Aeromonas salmonicida subsp. masoucida NBRC 13784]
MHQLMDMTGPASSMRRQLARFTAKPCPGHLIAEESKERSQQNDRPEYTVGEQLPHVDLGHELVIEGQHAPQRE